jgi:hypothetical protein
VFNTGGKNLAARFGLFENIGYFFRRGVSGKVPVMGFLPPQHIPHCPAHETDFPIPCGKQRGDFFKYGMNG